MRNRGQGLAVRALAAAVVFAGAAAYSLYLLAGGFTFAAVGAFTVAVEHATTAGAAGAAVAQLAAPAAPAQAKLFAAAVCFGADVVNDLDARRSRAARSFGPVTGLVALIVILLSGGHREKTHELWGEVFAGGLAVLCVAFISRTWAQVILGAVLAIVFACDLELIHRRSSRKVKTYHHRLSPHASGREGKARPGHGRSARNPAQ